MKHMLEVELMVHLVLVLDELTLFLDNLFYLL